MYFGRQRETRRNKNRFNSTPACVATEKLEERQLLSVAQPQMTGPGPSSDTTPRIEWNSVQGAVRLELWINRIEPSGAPSKVVHLKNLPGQSTGFQIGTSAVGLNASELPSGRYTAWVKGYDRRNATGGWSRPFGFSVGGQPAAKGVVTGPVSDTNQSPTITWNRIAGADRVELWVNRLDGPGTTPLTKAVYKSNISGATTQFRVGSDGGAPLQAGTYRAWVKGHNRNFGSVGWSRPFTFRVVAESRPSVGTLTGPNGLQRSSQPTLTWARFQNATDISIWINKVDAAGNRIESQYVQENDIPGTSTSFRIGTGQGRRTMEDGFYQAWVIGFNRRTQQWSSSYSNSVRFEVRTQSSSTRPVITPLAEEIYVVKPQINWTRVAEAVSYTITFDHDSGRFGNWGGVNDIVNETVSGNARAFSPAVGLPNGNYTVMVTATLRNGMKVSSTPETFRINVPNEVSGQSIERRRPDWTPTWWTDSFFDHRTSTRRNGYNAQQFDGWQVWDSVRYDSQQLVKRVEWYGIYPDTDLENVANQPKHSHFRIELQGNGQIARRESFDFRNANARIVGFAYIVVEGVREKVPVYRFDVRLKTSVRLLEKTTYDVSIVNLTDFRGNPAEEFTWISSGRQDGRRGHSIQRHYVFGIGQSGDTLTLPYDRAFTLFR